MHSQCRTLATSVIGEQYYNNNFVFKEQSLARETSTEDTFICRQCFRNAEKVIRLKEEASELESRMSEFMKRAGEERGLHGNTSEVSTPPGSDTR